MPARRRRDERRGGARGKAAKWDCEFIADLTAESTRLREAKMVRGPAALWVFSELWLQRGEEGTTG
jgi:hypothetical protein